MKKSEIRKIASTQRKALSDIEVHELSKELLGRFSQLNFLGMRTIHLFLPIEGKNEPDTFLFIDWLKANHPAVKILVPRADFDTALMTHHAFTTKEDLLKSNFNIFEPQKSEMHSGEIDMVLVPLLAFDSKGYRIGYGKGFYDRFLQQVQTKKIGLSFFESLKEDIDDVHENDIKLDLCITPQKVYDFRPESSIDF